MVDSGSTLVAIAANKIVHNTAAVVVYDIINYIHNCGEAVALHGPRLKVKSLEIRKQMN